MMYLCILCTQDPSINLIEIFDNYHKNGTIYKGFLKIVEIVKFLILISTLTN